MPEKRPTLKTIAEAVGVTPTTVSLALRNHPRISADTRERVLRVAAEVGYQPDAHLAHLMRHLRTPAHRKENPVMAVISDGPTRIENSKNPFSTWSGFAHRATELGYRPQEFAVTLERLSPARLGGVLRARGIHGVVFTALRDPEYVRRMDLSALASAVIGNVIRDPALPRATSDKFSNTVLLCERLWAMGFRRIGLVIPKTQEIRVEDTFLGGYLTFQFRHSHEGWPVPLAFEGEWEPTERILDWIAEYRPDAVVAAYPGIRRHLAASFPKSEDRPFVALINHLGDSQSPGISQRHDLVAAAAVNLVDGQLSRHSLGIMFNPATQLIRGTWVDGSSE